jgi:hypothetical protein
VTVFVTDGRTTRGAPARDAGSRSANEVAGTPFASCGRLGQSAHSSYGFGSPRVVDGLQIGEYGPHSAMVVGVLFKIQLGENPIGAGLDGLFADRQMTCNG